MGSFFSPSVLQQNSIFVLWSYTPSGSVPVLLFLLSLSSSSHLIKPDVRFVGQDPPFL